MKRWIGSAVRLTSGTCAYTYFPPVGSFRVTRVTSSATSTGSSSGSDYAGAEWDAALFGSTLRSGERTAGRGRCPCRPLVAPHLSSFYLVSVPRCRSYPPPVLSSALIAQPQASREISLRHITTPGLSLFKKTAPIGFRQSGLFATSHSHYIQIHKYI